jgi:hypothetical protein
MGEWVGLGVGVRVNEERSGDGLAGTRDWAALRGRGRGRVSGRAGCRGWARGGWAICS